MKLSNFKVNKDNPRIIKDEKFKKLVQSIIDFPEMMDKRPIVCVTDQQDKKLYPLGGNMRLNAILDIQKQGKEAILERLGQSGKEKNIDLLQPVFDDELPEKWYLIADDWDENQRKQFVIKDNVAFGEWDFDKLANKWDADELKE